MRESISLWCAALAPPLALAVGALGAARLLDRACGVGPNDPAGARLLTGIALFAAAAGWLVAAGSYGRAPALALLALGAAGFFLRAPGGGALAPRTAALPWLFAIGAFVVWRGLGTLRFPHYNTCDDLPQYLHFPRLVLESGNFVEPFSTRRLGVLGVGPLLQGFFWPGFGISANAVADAALGLPAIVGAACWLARAAAPAPPRASTQLAFALAALAATLAVPYLNTLPVLLPFAAALALCALHVRLAGRAPDGAGARDAIAFGLLAAVAIGLRVSNALLPAALWILALGRALAARDRGRVKLAALAAGATAIALAPWCLALWRSSGTPLFPLFAGNYRFADLFVEPMPPARTAAFVVECALVARAPWLPALAAVVAFDRERRGLGVDFALAGLVTVAGTALATSAFDSSTVMRYVAPLLFPTLLALGALSACAASRARRAALAALTALSLGVPATTHAVYEADVYTPLRRAQTAAREWTLAVRKLFEAGFTSETILGGDEYAAAQRALPPGARVIAAVEQPWEWNFAAHTFHSIDFPGPTSPPPGMPFFAGADAVADYFLALGYTHFAFTPPRRSLCLYSPAFAQANLVKGQWLWRNWAPYSLDFLRTERALAQTRAVVYRGPRLVVLDLRVRAPSVLPSR